MKIPRSKKDILVKTYLEYEDYVKNLDKENLNNNEILKNTIMIFCEISEVEYNKLKYQTILDLNQIIENILKIPQELVIKFKHNKKYYAINPNFDDITMGEWVDLDTDDILRQLCILYRPIKTRIGKKYIIEKYNADLTIYEDIKNWLTLDIYYGFISFFLKINKELLIYTLNSLTEDQDLDLEQKKILQASLDGILGYTDYVMKI